MPPFVLAILMGLTAGFRAFVPLAFLSWAAFAGKLPLADTHLAFMGNIVVAIILTLLAIAEFVFERLPASAGRPMFIPKLLLRLLAGGLAGACIGSSTQTNALFVCTTLGAASAIAGTFGETALRAALVRAFGKEGPALIVINVLAIALGFLILVPIH